MLKTLWSFSRPHTIIGSFVSVLTIFVLCNGNLKDDIFILCITLISALSCNLFITGLNQIIDEPLDKINKPNLPIPSGQLSKKNAISIVIVSLVISLMTAWVGGFRLFILILIILGLGLAYSMPPIQLKRHHIPAALAIVTVRGILVNIGMGLHFSSTVLSRFDLSNCFIALNTCLLPYAAILPITIFVTAFSIAIAWYKDLPDMVGDEHFGYKTFPLLYSKKMALYLGAGLVVLAYIFCICWSYIFGLTLILISHAVLLILFFINLAIVDLNSHVSIQKFYMIFWAFFFAEYLIFSVYWGFIQ